MEIARLLADNVLVRLLRGARARDDLVVSMTGLKLGERLLVVGLADPGLLGALGKKVGLTGRACGVDTSPDAAARAGRYAERAGVLVEARTATYDKLPMDPESFDVAVVRTRGDLAREPVLCAALHGLHQVLRDGGRCLALVDLAAGGLRGRLSQGPPGPPPGRVVQLLAEDGYRGARLLAEREGLAFVEAVHRR